MFRLTSRVGRFSKIARLAPALASVLRLPYAFRAAPTANNLLTSRTYALSTEGDNVELLIDQISDNQYNKIANNYLETLADELEMISEDYPQIDVELSQGVMTLSVAPEKTYVINKQPPNKQIWLSSPVSGPKRYDLIGGKWITLRDNSLLTQLLNEELTAELGEDVVLELNE